MQKTDEKKSESKISNVEWGLVIGALFTIDATQILLEWLVIGVFINPFIDIFVGMSFAFYLQLRGQSLASPKRLFALIGTFVGEMIPVVDELPLWGLDGIFNMVISKSDKILGQIPGGAGISKAIGGKGETPDTGSQGEQKSSSGADSGVRRIPLQSQNYAGAKQPGQSGQTEQKPRGISTLIDPEVNRMQSSQNKNLGDALDQLNYKPNRSSADNVKLTRAMYIMKNHSISDNDKSDPVYLAAWQKAQAGIETYSPEHIDGYKFNNVHYSY